MNMRVVLLNSLLLTASFMQGEESSIVSSTMKNDGEVVLAEQQNKAIVPTVWYKKRSTQIAAAVAICAVVAYVIAVDMNKISSPMALWAALPVVLMSKKKIRQANTNLLLADLATQRDSARVMSRMLDATVEVLRIHYNLRT